MLSSQCLNAQVVSTMLSTLNVMFNVTYYLELHNAISLTTNMFLYHLKLLMFYHVQTTNLTFVDKPWDVQYMDIALRNFKY